jgi:hypothetical protein
MDMRFACLIVVYRDINDTCLVLAVIARDEAIHNCSIVCHIERSEISNKLKMDSSLSLRMTIITLDSSTSLHSVSEWQEDMIWDQSICE